MAFLQTAEIRTVAGFPRMSGVAPLARITALTAFIALCFSILPDGLVWDRDPTDVDGVGGSLVRRLQWLPLFLVAAYVVWRYRDQAWRLIPHANPFLLALILYATCSLLWAAYPAATVRKLVLLYGLVLIGTSIVVAGWHPDRYATLLRRATTAMVALSIVLALAVPAIGKELDGDFAGYWRGARETKNLLAALAAANALLWFHALITRRTRAMIALAGFAAAMLCLLMSRGKTGLVSLFVAAPIVWCVARPPVDYRHLLMSGVLTVSALASTFVFAFVLATRRLPTWADITTPVALAVGKDPNLTGRDDLWVLMWEHIQSHWLFGFGYESFWLGATGPSGEIAEKLYWLPWQAHNGYIDLLNELGAVGLALFAGFTLYHLLQLRRLSASDRGNAALHLALLAMVLLANISESSLFRGLNIYWLLLLFSSLATSRALAGAAQPDPATAPNTAHRPHHRPPGTASCA